MRNIEYIKNNADINMALFEKMNLLEEIMEDLELELISVEINSANN